MARRKTHRSQPGEEGASEREAQEAPEESAAQQASGFNNDSQISFQAIVELAPDAIIVSTSDGRIVLVNHQAELLFGHSRNALHGSSLETLIPDDSQRRLLVRDIHSSPDSSLPSPGTSVRLFARRQDGGDFPVEVRLSPLGVDEKSLVIASFHDISELMRVEVANAALEAANTEQRQLLELTDTALSNLPLEELMGKLLSRVQEATNADNVAILLLDESGQELHVRAALGLEEEAVGKARIPNGQGFAGRIIATRKPLIVDDLATFPVVNPILRERLRSAVGVPLLAGERLIGVLHVDSVTPSHFGEQDIRMLELVGERIALAIDRAQLYEATLAARAEAERERARWQAAMDSAPAFVLTCDADLRLTYINSGYARLVGPRADLSTPPEERPARFGLLLPDGSGFIAPDQTPLARTLRERRAIRGSEFLYRNPETGEERLVLWDTAPIHAGNGSILGAVSVGWDITEQRRLERETHDYAAQLEAILEAVADGIAVYDTEGHVILSNAAFRAQSARFISGAPAETLRERNAQTLPTDENGELLTEERWAQTRALRGEVVSDVSSVEMTLRMPDGAVAIFRVTAAPLRDAMGQIIGAVTVSRDTTTRKRLEREHQEARARELAALEVSQRLDEFFSIAAHDIRNPVTSVYTSVQVLQRRLGRLRAEMTSETGVQAAAALEALDNSLRSARGSVERLIRLIDLLFDIAQARAGKLELRLAPCDLAAIVREQVTAQRAAEPERTIHLELPGDQPVWVSADADRLDEVLANYLTNALKYSARDRPVTVRLETEAGQAKVTVRDEGSGLSPVERLRIWEMFHRASNAAETSAVMGRNSSMGLGLHICKRLMEAHPGGQIGVESEEGVGSTFWFSLPLADDAPPPDDSQEPQ